MKRTHQIEGKEITIEWSRLDLEDSAGDGYCFIYGAEGYSEDGRVWGATWIECLGMVEIEDIELSDAVGMIIIP